MNRSEMKVIGGSDIAALFPSVGSKWKSRHSLYLHLIGELPPTEDNPAIERGRILEPVIADIFAANHEEFNVFKHSRSLENPEEEYRVYHQEHPFLMGSPDRLLLDGEFDEPVSGLEIKTADATKMSEWGDEETDEIPLAYYLQCQWYCGLLGLSDWYIAVGFVKPGSKKICGYREYRIEHDADRYAAMVQKAVEFWNDHVLKRIPPEIDEPDVATVEYYRRRTRIPEKEIFANDDLSAQVEAVVRRQNNLKEAERYFELEKTRLIAMMDDAEVIIDTATGKPLATYRQTKPIRKTNWEVAARLLGATDEFIEQYTTEQPGHRRFLVPK